MNTELEPAVEAEIVEPQALNKAQAKALDKKVRAASDKWANDRETLADLLDEAARGQIHEALGLPSWTAWFNDAVQIRPVDLTERKALVALMSERGMSQRAIAGVLGVSKGTVQNDQVETGQSCPVESNGLDGKVRKRKPKEPDSQREVLEGYEIKPEAEPEHRAPPITANFRDEMDTLLINVQAFKDILDDDERFPQARRGIAKRHLNALQRAISDLQNVAKVLIGDSNDASA